MEKQRRFDPHELTEDELERFRKRAFICAKQMGHPELADDFASAVFESIARGWRQTVDQACLDYLRQLYGRTGQPRYIAELLNKRRSLRLDQALGEDDGRIGHDVVGGSGGDPRDVLDFGSVSDIARRLKGTERKVIELYFGEELTLREVGQRLGMSEAWASIEVNKALEELKGEIRREMELEKHKTKCAEPTCARAAAPGWKYCGPNCAPGARYSNVEEKVTLQSRVCALDSCGKTFKVMASSKQLYHSTECLMNATGVGGVSGSRPTEFHPWKNGKSRPRVGPEIKNQEEEKSMEYENGFIDVDQMAEREAEAAESDYDPDLSEESDEPEAEDDEVEGLVTSLQLAQEVGVSDATIKSYVVRGIIAPRKPAKRGPGGHGALFDRNDCLRKIEEHKARKVHKTAAADPEEPQVAEVDHAEEQSEPDTEDNSNHVTALELATELGFPASSMNWYIKKGLFKPAGRRGRAFVYDLDECRKAFESKRQEKGESLKKKTSAKSKTTKAKKHVTNKAVKRGRKPKTTMARHSPRRGRSEAIGRIAFVGAGVGIAAAVAVICGMLWGA